MRTQGRPRKSGPLPVLCDEEPVRVLGFMGTETDEVEEQHSEQRASSFTANKMEQEGSYVPPPPQQQQCVAVVAAAR